MLVRINQPNRPDLHINQLITIKEMLTSTLRALVNNPYKESFYGKWKKKVINILAAFFISHKSCIKTFLKWIINECPKGTR